MRGRYLPITGLLLAVLLILGVIGGFRDAWAATKLEGYYETEAVMESDTNLKNDTHWTFQPPWQLFEFKIYSNPVRHFDLWVKFNSRSDWMYWDEVKSRFQLVEAHGRFYGDEWETILFVREDRYWLANVLSHYFTYVDGGRLRTSDNMGIRYDHRNLRGWRPTLIYSDFSTDSDVSWQSREDAFVAKLARLSWKDRLLLIGYYVRKDWNEGDATVPNSKYYNDVVAMDARLDLAFDIAAQVAHSRAPEDHLPEGIEKESWAMVIEARGIRFGPIRMVHSYRYYGDTFFNYLTNKFDRGGDQGRGGYRGELVFGIPYRAVTATFKFDRYHQRRAAAGITPQTVTDVYSELYVEFIHGFAMKLFHSRLDNKDGRWKHFFGELTVENFLAKLKTQFRVRDYDTRYEKISFGVDLGFKLGPRFKVNTRAMTIDERATARSRHSLWAQVIYDLGENMEINLDYGPSWHGDNDLVNDSSFADDSNADLTHRVGLRLKAWW